MTAKTTTSRLRHVGGIALAGLLVLGGTPTMAADKKTVKFGVPPWGGVEVKTAVVAKILEPLGYTVKQINASAPVVYEGLARGDVHINMSAWAPGQAPTFMPHVEKGKIVKLGENLKGAIAGFAVPEYVYKAGLTKAKLLPQYADRLNKQVYCIDPGSGANGVVNKAIKNNIYGLSGWKIVESSTAGMLSRVSKAVNDKEWIVFCGWRPHWMNVKYNMHYLEDPKNLWGPNGGESTVFTLATDSFPKTHPTLTKFFKRFVVDASVQSAWLFEYGQKNRSLDAVAHEWIKSNFDIIEPWLKGLQSLDGRDAMTVLRARYQ